MRDIRIYPGKQHSVVKICEKNECSCKVFPYAALFLGDFVCIQQL